MVNILIILPDFFNSKIKKLEAERKIRHDVLKNRPESCIRFIYWGNKEAQVETIRYLKKKKPSFVIFEQGFLINEITNIKIVIDRNKKTDLTVFIISDYSMEIKETISIKKFSEIKNFQTTSSQIMELELA